MKSMMNNKMKIRIFVFILIIITGFFLFYINIKEININKEIKLTISVVKSPPLAAVLIAESKGFFRDEGLEIEIKEFSSGKASLETMIETKSLDIAVPANLPVVLNSFNRDDYAIFAGFAKNDNFNKLLVREDIGIKVPADLNRKKIGVTKGTNGHYFLSLFLDHNKLKTSDVEVVDFKADDLALALADGKVDAISTWEPHIENSKKIIGIDARILASKGIVNDDFYFVAKKDFIQNNQDALIKFLKAVEKGNQFLKERPLESIDIVSKQLGINKISLISQWEDYEFGLYLDQTIFSSLEKQANWAVENGMVNATKIPYYHSYIYTGILDKVKPESVTITR